MFLVIVFFIAPSGNLRKLRKIWYLRTGFYNFTMILRRRELFYHRGHHLLLTASYLLVK